MVITPADGLLYPAYEQLHPQVRSAVLSGPSAAHFVGLDAPGKLAYLQAARRICASIPPPASGAAGVALSHDTQAQIFAAQPTWLAQAQLVAQGQQVTLTQGTSTFVVPGLGQTVQTGGAAGNALLPYMARSGGLADLNTDTDTELTDTWSALAADLKAYATGNGFTDIGKLRLYYTDQTYYCWDSANLNDQALMDRCRAFVLNFMRRNGQLAFIAQQPWFLDGSYDIVVDCNFYGDRAMETGNALGFHKDTAGQNLFVNLVFDNTTQTPATEWFPDGDAFPPARAAVLRTLMPDALVDQLLDAKARIAAQPPGGAQIRGGLFDPLAFLSWVDELVWHSSPSSEHRPAATPQAFADAVNAGNYTDPWVYTVSAYLVASSTSDFYPYFAGGTPTNAFSATTWPGFWAYVQSGGAAMEAAWKQVLIAEANAMTNDEWSAIARQVSGQSGEILDNPTSLQSEIHATQIGTRPRRNSDASALAAIRAAAPPGTKRSFIRTWVTVVKRGS
ncbi:MAG: hypothetical protein AAFQ19_05815 [Pseudomonadota bacterium]